MKYAITGSTIIDGTGRDPMDNAVVLVEGKKITEIGFKDEVSLSGAEEIKADGRWLLPGLIDLHVHLFNSSFISLNPKGSYQAYAGVLAAKNLRTTLQAGVTTVRGVSDLDRIDLALRDAVERGVILGSRVFGAGKGICMTGGHGSGWPAVMHEVDSPWAVRKAVREEVKAGVDLIKLLSSHRTDNREFTQEEINAGVDEGHGLGKKVAIHAANHVSVLQAAEAGVDTIEHGSFVDEKAADLMAEKNITIIPTLWVKNHIPKRIEKQRKESSDRPLWNLDAKDLEVTDTWFKRCVEQLPKTLKLVRSKKIRIGTGTDNVFPDQPFTMIPEEMEWMTRYSIPEMEVIQSATRIGAEAIGVEDKLGTIEKGKIADLIMVDKNPLEDITVFKNVSWVMKEGLIIPLEKEWERRPIQNPIKIQ
jgi:imidazolonepropionase-like amidohydrolase